jgi:ComF family protein
MHQPNVIEEIVTPYFHHFYALGKYEGILKPLINQLKFANKPLAAKVLAEFFVSCVYPRISMLDDAPEALIPIPLSAWRYSKRGYNQSLLLAEAIGQLINIPVIESLSRNRHTKAQSALGKSERLDNLHNAFCVKTDITFEHIAIIDDVVTTGATINSACKSLVEIYPDLTISVWSMAVTPAVKRTAKRKA